MTTKGNQDHIKIHADGGATFAGRDAVEIYRVTSLRRFIKLHKDTGIIPTRGVTITKMLASASAITGKTYVGKDKHAHAIEDLTTWLDAAKASMPVEVEGAGE